MYIFIWVCEYMSMYVNTGLNKNSVCVFVFVCPYVRGYAFVCLYMYIYIYRCIYMYMCRRCEYIRMFTCLSFVYLYMIKVYRRALTSYRAQEGPRRACKSYRRA